MTLERPLGQDVNDVARKLMHLHKRKALYAARTDLQAGHV